jgi:hypothetical protein
MSQRQMTTRIAAVAALHPEYAEIIVLDFLVNEMGFHCEVLAFGRVKMIL